MLLLGIITLVMTIPLASTYLSTILIHRIAFLILLFSSLLAYNTLYVIPLSSGIGILGGLFQTTLLSQSLEIFILIIGSIILLLAPSGEKINKELSSSIKKILKTLIKQQFYGTIGIIYHLILKKFYQLLIKDN
jgi:hypothetical protein